MHAVARNGPLLGLMLLLLVPLGENRAVTAGVSADGIATREARAADMATATQALAVGQPVPAVSLPSLRPDQDPIHLADLRGRVVILDFWSTWCAPCRRAMPHLDTLRQEFSHTDLEVVGVNVDLLANDARQFLEQVPVRYPIAADTGGLAARGLGVDVLPAMFLIDRQGVVREAIRGSRVEAHDQIRASLVKLIGAGEVQ